MLNYISLIHKRLLKSVRLFVLFFAASSIYATDLAPVGRIAPLVDQYLNDEISFSLKVGNLNVLTALAAEWHVEVTVKNSLGITVFTTTIAGVDLTPSQEVQVTAVNKWKPTTADEYQVIYHVMYLYEINPSNDTDQYYFNVWSAPSPASIFFPENGATDVPFSPPPTLTAQSGNVPVKETKIDLTVVEQDSGKSFTKTTDSSKISMTPGEDLKPATKYEWTVTQTNPSGSTVNGPFTFTTMQGSGTIEGTVYNDKNGNGVIDSPIVDIPLPGWMVKAKTGESAVSDSNGHYNLTLPAGKVELDLILQNAWLYAEPDSGKFVTTLNHGDHLTKVDFGVVPDSGAVSVADDKIIPEDFHLYQNYPNPFNPSTLITYDVAKTARVKLVVFNLIGQEIKILVDRIQVPGSYSVLFKSGDLPSGVYFYLITLNNYTYVRKMILMK